MSSLDRRRFLTLLATGASTPFILSMTGCGGGGSGSGGSGSGDDRSSNDGDSTANAPDFSNLRYDSQRVFPQTIASGDPSPSGVVLWTRIEPSEIIENESLWVQVANDPEFSDVVMLLEVEAGELNAARDYTVSVDTDALLNSNTRYYYRFVYANTASKTGRCRTAPPYGEAIDHLKMAVVTCQDYTNGYYGAFNAIANDDSIDFVISLGDFIYETAGDPKFQSLPFDDRRIALPSVDYPVAMELDDYRTLYRAYRSDPFLQRALENHTWVITRDDHETGNDAYWDYDSKTLGLPDHPYTTEAQFESQRKMLLNQLMLDSQQAWLEYVPARVTFDMDSSDPWQRLKYYRHIQFGNLVDLFMLDGRTYRSPHPCGENLALGRYAPLLCLDWQTDTSQTMLGAEQFSWLVNGLEASKSKWQLLGNQTFMAPIWFGFFAKPGADPYSFIRPINVDAWDGFDYERNMLSQAIKAAGVENLVVLTGDLHTYIASHVKLDYLDEDPSNADNFVGVEFMTPSVTSSGMFELIYNVLGAEAETNPIIKSFLENLSSFVIKENNKHIDYFNSDDHGYSTVEFTQDYCDWKCYAVDKNLNDGLQTPVMLKHYRKQPGNHLLQDFS